jgi:hypothetical protein
MPQDNIDTRTIAIRPESTNDMDSKNRVMAINDRLKILGADKYDLLVPETSALSYVLRTGESIEGIVFGHYRLDGGKSTGRGALIATDSRVILIDKKPLFIHIDEVIYGAISGVTYTRVGFNSTVIVHSKIGDIKIRTLNQKCAKSFVEAVEANIFKINGGQK